MDAWLAKRLRHGRMLLSGDALTRRLLKLRSALLRLQRPNPAPLAEILASPDGLSVVVRFLTDVKADLPAPALADTTQRMSQAIDRICHDLSFCNLFLHLDALTAFAELLLDGRLSSRTAQWSAFRALLGFTDNLDDPITNSISSHWRHTLLTRYSDRTEAGRRFSRGYSGLTRHVLACCLDRPNWFADSCATLYDRERHRWTHWVSLEEDITTETAVSANMQSASLHTGSTKAAPGLTSLVSSMMSGKSRSKQSRRTTADSHTLPTPSSGTVDRFVVNLVTSITGIVKRAQGQTVKDTRHFKVIHMDCPSRYECFTIPTVTKLADSTNLSWLNSCPCCSTYCHGTLVAPDSLDPIPIQVYSCADFTINTYHNADIYARQAFKNNKTRAFVDILTINSFNARLWKFKRSGTVSSFQFNVNTHWKRLVRIIVTFLTVSRADLGYAALLAPVPIPTSDDSPNTPVPNLTGTVTIVQRVQQAAQVERGSYTELHISELLQCIKLTNNGTSWYSMRAVSSMIQQSTYRPQSSRHLRQSSPQPEHPVILEQPLQLPELVPEPGPEPLLNPEPEPIAEPAEPEEPEPVPIQEPLPERVSEQPELERRFTIPLDPSSQQLTLPRRCSLSMLLSRSSNASTPNTWLFGRNIVHSGEASTELTPIVNSRLRLCDYAGSCERPGSPRIVELD